MCQTMDLEIWKQHRDEMIHEAEQNRLSRSLRDSRKRRDGGRASSLAWESKRLAGHLLKLLRTSKDAGRRQPGVRSVDGHRRTASKPAKKRG